MASRKCHLLVPWVELEVKVKVFNLERPQLLHVQVMCINVHANSCLLSGLTNINETKLKDMHSKLCKTENKNHVHQSSLSLVIHVFIHSFLSYIYLYTTTAP